MTNNDPRFLHLAIGIFLFSIAYVILSIFGEAPPAATIASLLALLLAAPFLSKGLKR